MQFKTQRPTLHKERFLKHFRQRHVLRYHMGVILFATGFSGILISKLLFVLHVDNFVLRYAIAVILSYLVFFVCIKLWLLYISPKRATKSNLADWLDIPVPSGGSSGESIPVLHGGGGKFFGAGASGSFDAHSSIATEMPVSTIAEGTSGGISGVGDVVSGAADAVGDEGGIIGIVVLAVLAALVATILGGALYIIMEAPVILSEAAFEGLLAVSLVKKTRAIDGENWMGSVFKTTWIPFAVTLGVAILVGLFLHEYFPEAHRLLDILKKG